MFGGFQDDNRLFIRSVQVPSSNGTVHEYIRIVGAVREHGRVQQKVIAPLGRRATWEAVLPLLTRLRKGQESPQPLAEHRGAEGPIEVRDARSGGPRLLVRHVVDQRGLWQLLEAGRRWPKLRPSEDPHDDWVSRVVVLITNRLVRPTSEQAAAAWLETADVGDRRGRRAGPCWQPRGRGRVATTPLQRC